MRSLSRAVSKRSGRLSAGALSENSLGGLFRSEFLSNYT